MIAILNSMTNNYVLEVVRDIVKNIIEGVTNSTNRYAKETIKFTNVLLMYDTPMR